MAVPKNYDDFIFVKHNDTKIEQSKSLFFPKIKKIYKRMHFSFLIDRAEWVSEWVRREDKKGRKKFSKDERDFTDIILLVWRLASIAPKKTKKIFKGDETLVFRSRVSECARVRASSWCGIHTFLFLHSLSLSPPRDVFLHSYLKNLFAFRKFYLFLEKKIQKYKRRGDKEERMILAWKSAAISY